MLNRIQSHDPSLPPKEESAAASSAATIGRSSPLLAEIETKSPTKMGSFTAVFRGAEAKYRQELAKQHNIPKNALKGLSKEQLQEVEALLSYEGGKKYFLSLKEVAKGVEQFFGALQEGESLLNLADEMSYVKMNADERLAFLQDIAAIYLENPSDWAEFKKTFSTFLQKVQGEQAKRPQIDLKLGIELSTDTVLLAMQMGSEPRPAVQAVLNNLCDATACTNTQILHEVWEMCIRPLSARTVEFLTPRREGTQLTLYREAHPPIYLQEREESEVIDTATLKGEVLITHPVTLQTHRLSLPFPIQEKMEVKKLRQRIEELCAFFHGEESFDRDHPNYEHRAAFARFVEEGSLALACALADFNKAGEWQAGDFARKTRETAAFLDEPTEEKALKAACRGNLYLFGMSRLSLLPPGSEIDFGTTAIFSGGEIANLMIAMSEESPFPVEIDTPKGKATFTIEKTIIDTENFPRIETVMKITQGETAISRTTHYRLLNHDSAATVRSVIDHSLFERDALLAKRAFLEKISGG